VTVSAHETIKVSKGEHVYCQVAAITHDQGRPVNDPGRADEEDKFLHAQFCGEGLTVDYDQSYFVAPSDGHVRMVGGRGQYKFTVLGTGAPSAHLPTRM
jgi:hypothetical protein